MEGFKGNSWKEDLHRRHKDIHGGMTSMEGIKGNSWKNDHHRRLKDLHGGMIFMEKGSPWMDDLHLGI